MQINILKKWEEVLNRYFSKEDIPIANKHIERFSDTLGLTS